MAKGTAPHDAPSREYGCSTPGAGVHAERVPRCNGHNWGRPRRCSFRGRCRVLLWGPPRWQGCVALLIPSQPGDPRDGRGEPPWVRLEKPVQEPCSGQVRNRHECTSYGQRHRSLVHCVSPPAPHLLRWALAGQDTGHRSCETWPCALVPFFSEITCSLSLHFLRRGPQRAGPVGGCVSVYGRSVTLPRCLVLVFTCQDRIWGVWQRPRIGF